MELERGMACQMVLKSGTTLRIVFERHGVSHHT